MRSTKGNAMTLKVIGTGLGRTGTMSLKAALDQLGFGPCYHMSELMQRPQQVKDWARAAAGEPIDWNALYAGFVSTVDWPSAHFWRELTRQFPEAKIIHTEREPEVWWKSFSQTIAEALEAPAPPGMEAWGAMVKTVITTQTFNNDLSKANVLKVYAAHNDEVKRTIPPSRRLDYDVDRGAGWEPLCRFLNVPVPAQPFPKTNNTAEFRARFTARR
jgi:hypothetical protein